MSSFHQGNLFDDKPFQGESGLQAHKLPRFPTTRYQGSKRKILTELAAVFERLPFNSALDLYSGSGMVTLLLRHLGKQVDSNDFQLFNQAVSRLFIQLTTPYLRDLHYELELPSLLETSHVEYQHLVKQRYADIFFTGEENDEIDRFCQNLVDKPSLRHDLYVYAVGQALLKKRPYNLFHRANLNMRKRDVKRSFGNAVTWETPILEHALTAITELRKFPFPDTSGNGKTFGQNTADLAPLPDDYDLIYLDPPYLNSRGAGVDYSDFYSFLEGLCDYSLFTQGEEIYPHRPIQKKSSRWQRTSLALEELSAICRKWPKSILLFSYRSDGLPTPAEAAEVLRQGGRTVEIHSAGEYKYALSRTNTNEELFLVSFP